MTQRPFCFTPQVIRTAYGIQPLLDQRIAGHGVTVVLPETAVTGQAQPRVLTDIRQDVADFDRRFGLPPARIRVITTLAGSSASPWLARLEEVEDTELVHEVAPGATIAELLVNAADVSSPASAATTFAALVRRASHTGEVISLSDSFGEHFFTTAQAAAIGSALEYAPFPARHLHRIVGR